jgi:hypothetical protein
MTQNEADIAFDVLGFGTARNAGHKAEARAVSIVWQDRCA